MSELLLAVWIRDLLGQVLHIQVHEAKLVILEGAMRFARAAGRRSDPAVVVWQGQKLEPGGKHAPQASMADRLAGHDHAGRAHGGTGTSTENS